MPVVRSVCASAIEAANAQSAGSTINLTVAGTYAAVSGHGGTDQSTAGAFTILPSSGGLTITNTSGGAVLVAGSGFDRVFDINPADHLIACTVAMSGFTIESGTAAGNGGGIRDRGPVSLTLINMVLTNNMATANGGGLSMANATNQEWTLTIYNSAISTNSAGGAGGGIETEGSGQVAMSGDVINANKAQNGGAGIWLGGIATPPGSVQSTIITAGGSGYIGTPNVAFTEPVPRTLVREPRRWSAVRSPASPSPTPPTTRASPQRRPSRSRPAQRTAAAWRPRPRPAW